MNHSLYFIKFPKWAIDLLNSQMAHCLWNNIEGNKNFHLANWPSVCMKKEFGGLGIPDLRDLNVCLLSSWVKRYNDSGDKLWRQLVDFKYRTCEPNIFTCKDLRCSHFGKVSCGRLLQLK